MRAISQDPTVREPTRASPQLPLRTTSDASPRGSRLPGGAPLYPSASISRISFDQPVTDDTDETAFQRYLGGTGVTSYNTSDISPQSVETLGRVAHTGDVVSGTGEVGTGGGHRHTLENLPLYIYLNPCSPLPAHPLLAGVPVY